MDNGKMPIIGVPSGIGDVSWMYSKLKHVSKKLEIEVADGWPYRTVPYLELLPNVYRASYGDFQYPQIVAAEVCNGINGKTIWRDLASQEHGRLLLEANRHLEAGKRLEEWLPDLPCDFHYQMLTTAEDTERAHKIIDGLKHPLIGISAASYRGSEAWKTWGFNEWKPFLQWLTTETGGDILLMGGFWDDLTSVLAEEGYRDAVGRTSIGVAVEVLKLLDGYLGFSSGLGVLMTVLDRPTFMLWPDHQVELSTSWAPPDMLATGTYTTSLWREPTLVQRSVKRWLRYV